MATKHTARAAILQALSTGPQRGPVLRRICFELDYGPGRAEHTLSRLARDGLVVRTQCGTVARPSVWALAEHTQRAPIVAAQRARLARLQAEVRCLERVAALLDTLLGGA